jgi:asparagine synthetase B (glutamine-hydrolysing)
MYIKIPIIPTKPTFFGTKTKIDYPAICVFAATGFFLDDDTYYTDLKVLKPAHEYEIDEKTNKILSSKPYFKWNYNPIDRPLSEVVNDFATLFETIIKEQVGNKKVILPLSGGLDSRSQAAALYYLKNKVNAYSYSFTDGHNETEYAAKIASACGFPIKKWQIPYGYLWPAIDRLSRINGCYSEFTHPRQMAFVKEYSSMGEVFSLGHWGDVLFDDMGVPDDLSLEEQVAILYKKVIKKGGLELADSLWKSFGLSGTFEGYLSERIKNLLLQIDIKTNANAQIRAFKSLYWAPRWTSVNLSVFEAAAPIAVPYYDNRMCEFICSIPEKYLAGRQIQIEYLKLRQPALARITWQDHRPFNLYTYHKNRFPYNLPYKIINKIKQQLFSKKIIQRNWELQFIGTKNEAELKNRLFENQIFKEYIDPKLVADFYDKFKTKNAVFYSHSVSILLTLSLFFKNNRNE